MEITEVRVRKYPGNGKLKAFASVTFDHCFVVHDIKIIEGNKGLFVAMPSRKLPDGSHRDVAHPIHSDMRTGMERAILDEYGKAIDGVTGDAAEFDDAAMGIAEEEPQPAAKELEAKEPEAKEPQPAVKEPEAKEPQPAAKEPQPAAKVPENAADDAPDSYSDSDENFGTRLSSASGTPPSLTF